MLIKTQTNQIDTPVLNSKCQYNHVIYGCIGEHKACSKKFERANVYIIVTAAVLSHAHVITNECSAKSIQKTNIKKNITIELQ